MPHNLAREIDFVMGRTNARTELHHKIRGPRTKTLRHRVNGGGGDTQLRPFFPRVDQADYIPDGINDENSAAIGDVNAEANAALIGDQAIAAVKTPILFRRLVDNADPGSMHLLRGDERRAFESMFLSDFAMSSVQSSERFRLVEGHRKASDAQSEGVCDVGPRVQRGKLFGQALTRAHLPEVVVRVLVV